MYVSLSQPTMAIVVPLVAALALFASTLVVATAPMADCMSDANTLKDQASRNGINFGVAAETSYFQSPRFKSLLMNEFNMLVAENEMKMQYIFTPSTTTPGKGTYDFTKPDMLMQLAKDNRLKVRGHTLLWHNAIPHGIQAWSMSQQQWRDWVVDYITIVVKRYSGQIMEWDVVNEVYVHSAIDGESGPNGMRDSFWLRVLGPDYVQLCFRAAHAADPSARLYYNDYAAEWSNPKTDIIFDKLTEMKRNGVPVHGMGFQGHISYYDGNIAQYRSNFERFIKAGFDISLTEVDIFQDCMTTGGYFEKQAEIYAVFIKMAIELNFVNFLVWGLHDGVSWVNAHQHLFPCRGNPLLFENDMSPKPAYYAVKKAMCDMTDNRKMPHGLPGARPTFGDSTSTEEESGDAQFPTDSTDSDTDASAGNGVVAFPGGTGGGSAGPPVDPPHGDSSNTGGDQAGQRKIGASDFDNKSYGSDGGNGTWLLYSDDDWIETSFKDLEGHQKLIVKVKPHFAGDSFPQVNVYVDEKLVTSRPVSKSPQWNSVVLDKPLKGDHIVRVVFTNDGGPGGGRNLVVVHAVLKTL